MSQLNPVSKTRFHKLEILFHVFSFFFRFLIFKIQIEGNYSPQKGNSEVSYRRRTKTRNLYIYVYRECTEVSKRNKINKPNCSGLDFFLHSSWKLK